MKYILLAKEKCNEILFRIRELLGSFRQGLPSLLYMYARAMGILLLWHSKLRIHGVHT